MRLLSLVHNYHSFVSPPPDFNAARDLHFACHCKALQYFFFANRPSIQSRIIQSMRPCALHASFQKAYVLALTHGSSSGRRAEKWTKKNQARLWQPRHGVYIKKGKNDVCDRVFFRPSEATPCGNIQFSRGCRAKRYITRMPNVTRTRLGKELRSSVFRRDTRSV
jgi:hypothetical protein